MPGEKFIAGALSLLRGCPFFFALVFVSSVAAAAPVCKEQPAKDFLIRGNMLKDKAGFKHAVSVAVRYRVGKYGPVAKASSRSAVTHFMNLPVRLHRKIIPIIQCVETALVQECGRAGDYYAPQRLSGLRYKNTYRGGEISNHMFGIALDVDPDRNPCCGCVPPWSEVPRCQKRVSSIFERTDLTRCWVKVFERYGFYWLGWDQMGDTMHFEFLGDPDDALKKEVF